MAKEDDQERCTNLYGSKHRMIDVFRHGAGLATRPF